MALRLGETNLPWLRKTSQGHQILLSLVRMRVPIFKRGEEGGGSEGAVRGEFLREKLFQSENFSFQRI